MEPFLGEIRVFGGTYAPQGWAFCDGASLNVNGNEALYSLIGTTYGGSSTTFNLPDLRGRMPIGQGQGTGLSLRLIAQNGGSQTQGLTLAQTPAHSHTVTVGTNTNNATTSPGNNYLGTLVTSSGKTFMYTPGATPGITDSPLNINVVSTALGGNLPHNNMMPYTGVNFIIATQGIYPTRS